MDAVKSFLFGAIRHGNVQIIRHIVESKPELIDQEFDEGRGVGTAPLVAAIQFRQLDVLKLLLENGANVHHENELGYTPLWFAFLNNWPEAARILLKYNADPTIRNDDGDTMLHYTAYKNNISMMTVLIVENNVPVDLQNELGQTALMCACEEPSSLPILRELGALGANLNLQDNEGDTALMQATSADNGEAVRWLLERGANLDIANLDGDTPFLRSCVEQRRTCTFLLMRKSPQTWDRLQLLLRKKPRLQKRKHADTCDSAIAG